MKRALAVLGAVAILGVGFGWGYLAHRNRVFPYPQVRSLAVTMGWLDPATPVRKEVWREPKALGALETLPYIDGLPDPEPDRGGVLLHDPDRAYPGANLYSPRELGEAHLLGMDGRQLWKWSYPRSRWLHVEVLPGGELLVVRKDIDLFKLDRRSNLLWSVEDRFHHDLWVTDDGRIYTLTRRDEVVPEVHPEIPTVVDRITVLGPEGDRLQDISLLEVIQESELAFLLPEFGSMDLSSDEGALDVLHTNHVEVFDGSLAHRSELFARGNLLISMRSLHTVAILDGESLEVLWAWGPGNLVFQHQPTLLENGHLLIFDNGTEASEIVELDPLERRVVWRYRAEDFFTRTRGSLQRLPNGNTLITETDTGYVFEVTPEGERVWVFANPEVDEEGRRMAIWRMTRLDFADLPFLGSRGADG